MFVLKQRFGSSGENSDEDVSEGDILQVKAFVFQKINEKCGKKIFFRL